jgi:hypothetical protein
MSENAWIEWSGGECPVADDALIQVRFRVWEEGQGESLKKNPPQPARRFRWYHNDSGSDIIAYRLSGPSA